MEMEFIPDSRIGETLLNKDNFMSNIFILNKKDFISALVSFVVVALIEALSYVIKVGDLWKIDLHTLINAGILPAFIFAVSILKSFLTTSSGKFIGLIPIK